MLTEEQAETIQEPDEHKLICALPGYESDLVLQFWV
jgi:hypothetical protein